MEKSKKKAGQQWDRVSGEDLHGFNVGRANKNKSIMTNDIFIQACKKVNLMPTKRQASKWNNKKGLAYKYKDQIKQG